jgi:hypothetical protein
MTHHALALLLAALAATQGCVIGRYSEGEVIAADQIPRIVPGQTTKRDILEWFGSPQSFAEATFLEEYLADQELLPGDVLDLPFADVLVYRLTRGRLRGVVMILFNHIRLEVASDTLVVFFDERDRVLYYGWRQGTNVLD